MKVYVFFNTQRTRKDGTFPVYVCVSRPPKRFYVHTGLFTSVKFDADTFPRTERNHKAKTALLARYLDEIEEIVLKNSLLSDKALREMIQSKVFGTYRTKNTLVSYIDEFSELHSGSTKVAYDYAAKNVSEYDEKADLNITQQWLEGFVAWHKRQGHKNNTINSNLQCLSAVFNWAIKQDITSNYPFRGFKKPATEARKRNLTRQELRSIIDNNTLNGDMLVARDIFILMFYLIGINSADLFQMKRTQLINGRLEYTRRKTKKKYSIKVEPEAMEIIKRYQGKEHLLRFCDTVKDYHLVSSKVNYALKKIDTKLSTYFSRHTWASLASALDIPIDTISAALGHSYGAKITNVYVNFDLKKIDEANRKVIDFVLEKGSGE